MFGWTLCSMNRGRWSCHPLHAVIACYGHGFGRGINSKKRPRAGDEWVLLGDAFINFHAEAGSVRHDQIAALDGERFTQNFVSEWEWIHPHPASVGIARVLQPLNDV